VGRWGILLYLRLVLLLSHHFLLPLLQRHLPLHFILLLLGGLLLFRVACILIIVHFIHAFWDDSHLLLLPYTEVQFLSLSNVAVKTFNFKLVCVHL